MAHCPPTPEFGHLHGPQSVGNKRSIIKQRPGSRGKWGSADAVRPRSSDEEQSWVCTWTEHPDINWAGPNGSYWICGEKAWPWFPPVWIGRCSLGLLWGPHKFVNTLKNPLVGNYRAEKIRWQRDYLPHSQVCVETSASKRNSWHNAGGKHFQKSHGNSLGYHSLSPGRYWDRNDQYKRCCFTEPLSVGPDYCCPGWVGGWGRAMRHRNAVYTSVMNKA